MKIFVDADSSPVPVRSVVMKAAERTNSVDVFVANRIIPNLQGGSVMELCPAEDGAADDRIVSLAESGDLVITRDVGLAKRLVEKSIAVIDDRGRQFTKENIGELYSIRCFNVGLAESGAEIIRTANYTKKDIKTFADSFDKILRTLIK
jgi:uncharacterized protein YaiI (UPF0178 family)